MLSRLADDLRAVGPIHGSITLEISSGRSRTVIPGLLLAQDARPCLSLQAPNRFVIQNRRLTQREAAQEGLGPILPSFRFVFVIETLARKLLAGRAWA